MAGSASSVPRYGLALERACRRRRLVAELPLLGHQLLHAVVVGADDLLQLVLPLLRRRQDAGRGGEVGACLLRLEREAQRGPVRRDLRECVCHVVLLWSSRRRSYPVAADSTTAVGGRGSALTAAAAAREGGGGWADRPPSAPERFGKRSPAASAAGASAVSAVDGALPGADLLLLLVLLGEPARGDALGLGEERDAVLAAARAGRRRSESLCPANGKKLTGTGMPTLMPTMPACVRRANSRA